jgi:hypothetical protein
MDAPLRHDIRQLDSTRSTLVPPDQEQFSEESSRPRWLQDRIAAWLWPSLKGLLCAIPSPLAEGSIDRPHFCFCGGLTLLPG